MPHPLLMIMPSPSRPNQATRPIKHKRVVHRKNSRHLIRTRLLQVSIAENMHRLPACKEAADLLHVRIPAVENVHLFADGGWLAVGLVEGHPGVWEDDVL